MHDQTFPSDQMPEHRARRAKAGGTSLSTTYVVIWLLLGAVATGYLAVLASKPDILMASTQHLKAIAAAPGAKGIADLQRSVTALEQDVTSLKRLAQVHDGREKAIVERVSVIENRISGIAATAQLPSAQLPAAQLSPGQLPAAPPAAVASTAAVDQAASTQLSMDPRRPLRLVATAPVPAAPKAAETKRIAAKVDAKSEQRIEAALPLPAADSTAGIQTGSIVAPNAGRPIGVRLASGPSVDALRLSWSLLTERHKTSLKSLEPRYSGSEASSYQLVAGPVANAAEAQRLCQSLRTRGVTCAPAEFAGEGL